MSNHKSKKYTLARKGISCFRTMHERTATQDELECTQDSAVEKMTLYGKFEDISQETNQILIQVRETIRELKSRMSVRSSQDDVSTFFAK